MKELLYSFITSATRPKLDGTAECAFVIGKSKNAPIKNVSVPRLELQEALSAACIDLAVRKELNFEFEKVVFWTDSTTRTLKLVWLIKLERLGTSHYHNSRDIVLEN